MKQIVLLVVMILSSNVFAKDISIKVSGMVCSLCAQGIQKKFLKLHEVKEIKVDLDSKLVFITTKDDQDIQDKVINDLITEAGYNVASIERK